MGKQATTVWFGWVASTVRRPHLACLRAGAGQEGALPVSLTHAQTDPKIHGFESSLANIHFPNQSSRLPTSTRIVLVIVIFGGTRTPFRSKPQSTTQVKSVNVFTAHWSHIIEGLQQDNTEIIKYILGIIVVEDS